MRERGVSLLVVGLFVFGSTSAGVPEIASFEGMVLAHGSSPSRLWAESAQESAPKADEALLRFVASAGEKASALSSFAVEGQSVLTTPQGKLTAVIEVYFVAPERYREETTLPFGKIVTVLNGVEGWASTPRGVQDLTPDQRTRTRQALFRSYLGLLWAAAGGRLEARLLGSGEVEGSPVTELSLGIETAEMRAFFDEASGRLLKLSLQGASLSGSPVREERVFSGFEVQSGLSIPTKVRIFHDGELTAEGTMTSIRVNPTLEAELFEPPKGR